MLGLPSSSIFLYNSFVRNNFLFQELEHLVSQCDKCVLYQPIHGEVDYNDRVFPLILNQERILLPNSRRTDPLLWADKSVEQYKGSKTYVLVPGKTFDIYGTRHGRGGGWYDRFLSRIPTDWVRIGVAHASQISKTPILKNSWDESVDWIIIKNEDSTEFDCLKISQTRLH